MFSFNFDRSYENFTSNATKNIFIKVRYEKICQKENIEYYNSIKAEEEKENISEISKEEKEEEKYDFMTQKEVDSLVKKWKKHKHPKVFKSKN